MDLEKSNPQSHICHVIYRCPDASPEERGFQSVQFSLLELNMSTIAAVIMFSPRYFCYNEIHVLTNKCENASGHKRSDKASHSHIFVSTFKNETADTGRTVRRKFCEYTNSSNIRLRGKEAQRGTGRGKGNCRAINNSASVSEFFFLENYLLSKAFEWSEYVKQIFLRLFVWCTTSKYTQSSWIQTSQVNFTLAS